MICGLTTKRVLIVISLLLCFSGLSFAKKVVIGKNCYELDSKTMTAKLTFFDKNSVMSSESYLKKVDIPEVVEYDGKTYTVTGIDADCFWKNWDKLHGLSSTWPGLTITIPKTIERIDEQAFVYRDIIEFKVDPNNPYFTLKDNILYDKSFTKAICAPKDAITDKLELPATIKEIYPKAFSGQGYTKISKLVLPEGLEIIGKDAFTYTHIDTLVVPGSVKEIGLRALYHCCKNLIIEEGVETIGWAAYDGSLESLKLPKSLKRIEDGAFFWYAFNEESVIPVHISENVEYMGQYAFNVENAQFIVDPNNKYYSSDEYALYNKDKSQLLHVSMTAGKTYRIPASVSSIEGLIVFRDVDTLIIDHPLKQYITKNRSREANRWDKEHNNLSYTKVIYAISSEIPKIRKYHNNVRDISELKK